MMRDERSYYMEERLCDIAAAELMMPRSIFDEYKHLPIKVMAELFNVSPLMIAVRMMETESLSLEWWAMSARMYKRFDKAAFIEQQLKRGKPYVIAWVLSTTRLQCRGLDVYGVPDLFGISEIPTLFSWARMKSCRVFLIPYLVTGYSVPTKLEEEAKIGVHYNARR